MSQPQSSSGQPPPSPVVYPQGGIPPQGQPQRALYAPNTQQMGPTPQAGPAPAAQYPPAYYQQKSQPGYPQPPLYRQQGAQSVPVRAYLGNQPAQMATSPAYSTFVEDTVQVSRIVQNINGASPTM
ncbi:unnamed protein product [Toxocara canis]|uniref:Vesicle coat complex copii subunit sec31 n=1 Tax=Toxocara canis TaxID=6265 RepID=A0A183UGT9_TOXCA|nr:unnamed protein product [Toxocara canis]